MKLATFEVKGREGVGIVVDEKIIDLHTVSEELPSSMLEFIGLGKKGLKKAKKILTQMEKTGFKDPKVVFPLREVKLKAPIQNPSKLVCIGLNYDDYRKMLGYPKPEIPLFFLKPPSTIIGPDETIVIPRGKWPGTSSNCLFQEWELAIVIGKRARHVPKEKAYDYIFGYTIFTDVTAHDIEMVNPGHVLYQQRSKAFDSFSPMGPWIVTKDQMPDPHNIKMTRKRNGKIEYESTTKYMIWKIPQIIEFLTEIMTLNPGDVVPTASPPAGPEEGFQPGDVIESIIEGIGSLRNPVVLEKR